MRGAGGSSPSTGPESHALRTCETFEPRTFDWQASAANDTSWRGKGRQWIEHRPGEVAALQTTKTWALWMEPSTSSQVDSHAKTSPSPDAEPDSPASDQGCSSSSHGSPMSLFDQEDGSSLRTSPACSVPPVDEISQSWSGRWGTSGFTTSPGECWTAVTSECPSGGDASSSLADVLLDEVPERFFLSPRAAAGILRRAEKRGRELPPALAEALAALASAHRDDGRRMTRTSSPDRATVDQEVPTTTTPRLTTSSLAPSDHTIGSTVRRLTPTECERLQGFPDGWTIPQRSTSEAAKKGHG